MDSLSAPLLAIRCYDPRSRDEQDSASSQSRPYASVRIHLVLMDQVPSSFARSPRTIRLSRTANADDRISRDMRPEMMEGHRPSPITDGDTLALLDHQETRKLIRGIGREEHAEGVWWRETEWFAARRVATKPRPWLVEPSYVRRLAIQQPQSPASAVDDRLERSAVRIQSQGD